MGGDGLHAIDAKFNTGLNPPRPHGRGPYPPSFVSFQFIGLKSTPPAWAGTKLDKTTIKITNSLNPPRPHGRGPISGLRVCARCGLNPPRPHGRGRFRTRISALDPSGLNPPRPHGRGQHRVALSNCCLSLNPPRQHGRGRSRGQAGPRRCPA